MARTALVPQDITRAGLNVTMSAANVDGHSIVNNGKTWMRVTNGGASPITVTQRIPKLIDGVAPANSGKQVSIPAGGTRELGPWPPEDYAQADGSVWVDFSAVSSVTVAAIRLP